MRLTSFLTEKSNGRTPLTAHHSPLTVLSLCQYVKELLPGTGNENSEYSEYSENSECSETPLTAHPLIRSPLIVCLLQR